MFNGIFYFSRMAYSKDGNAGAIRDAGGAFGKMETAEEARYFNKLVILSFSL